MSMRDKILARLRWAVVLCIVWETLGGTALASGELIPVGRPVGLSVELAGILVAGKLYSAQPNAGKGWETTAIAMCALGGVKLSGGEGKFSGAFFGAMVIAVITTIFNYSPSINTWWQNVVMGLLLLISVGLQSEVFKVHRSTRKADRQGAAA